MSQPNLGAAAGIHSCTVSKVGNCSLLLAVPVGLQLLGSVAVSLQAAASAPAPADPSRREGFLD